MHSTCVGGCAHTQEHAQMCIGGLCTYVSTYADALTYVYGSKRLTFSMFLYFTSDLLRNGFLINFHCPLDRA